MTSPHADRGWRGPLGDASTVQERVADVIRARPEHVAVADRHASLTYAALDRRAGRLTADLDARGVPRDRPVAVALTDGVPATVALWAVVRSGRFYVGLDPTAAAGRLRSLVEDAAPAAVVTSARHHGRILPVLPAGPTAPIVLEVPGPDDEIDTPSPVVRGGHDDPLSLAYSSGTTGTPKGVVLPQGMHLHLCRMPVEADLGAADRFGMVFSGAFTPLMTYPFRALVHGATLCPYDLRRPDTPDVHTWLVQERVTVWHTVPTVARHLVARSERPQPVPDLRFVYFTGEALGWDDVGFYRDRLSSTAVYANGVGATEAGPYAVHVVDPEVSPGSGDVPAGRPAPAKEVVLRDDQGRPVPDGTIGTVVVRSRHLPSGYWRRPDLTAEVFRETGEPGVREVRLADQMRRRADGLLEHRGRADEVVKVEGTRVDLGEVREAMRAAPGIVDAAVVVTRDGTLAAFVVGDDVDVAQLRASAAGTLSPVAIPPILRVLPVLPRLPSGKVDRAELVEAAGAGTATWDLPSRETARADEREVLRIWQGLFPDHTVHLDDDWFELGGTSVLAARLVVAVERELGVDLPVSTVATAPTVRGFARCVREAPADRWARLVTLSRGDDTRPPLFAFHALFGNALMFRDLAEHLGADQGVVGVQSPVLAGHRATWRSLDDLADLYLADVRSRQPHGPYLLFGQSFGGVMAFEVARRLVAVGEEVGLVGLGDSMCPVRPDRAAWRRGRGNVERLLRLDRVDSTRGVGVAVRAMAGNAVWHLREAGRLVRARRALHRDGRVPPELRGSYARALHLRATHRHVPGPAPIDVLLVRSSDRDADERRGWGTVARRVDIVRVDAPHGAIVQEPHVARTSAYLRAHIDAYLAGRAFASPHPGPGTPTD